MARNQIKFRRGSNNKVGAEIIGCHGRHPPQAAPTARYGIVVRHDADASGVDGPAGEDLRYRRSRCCQ